MIDSHVNLHHELYEGEISEVIKRAHDNGVGAMLTICDKMENLKQIREICHSYDNIWHSVGVHPHYAKDHSDLSKGDLVINSYDALAIGIGEAGLDFHYNFSPKSDQIAVFETHIEAAQETQLPLIVHTRLADDLTGDILEKAMKHKAFPLLMHCYTSSNELMKRTLSLDAYVSISGIATFKNATDVRQNILDIPNNRLLIETDCPYLSPIPMRGQRNEPSFIRYILKFMSDFKSINTDELETMLDDNFLRLFAKAKLVSYA